MISDYELFSIGWERVGNQIFSPKSTVMPSTTAKPFHIIYHPNGANVWLVCDGYSSVFIPELGTIEQVKTLCRALFIPITEES